MHTFILCSDYRDLIYIERPALHTTQTPCIHILTCGFFWVFQLRVTCRWLHPRQSGWWARPAASRVVSVTAGHMRLHAFAWLSISFKELPHSLQLCMGHMIELKGKANMHCCFCLLSGPDTPEPLFPTELNIRHVSGAKQPESCQTAETLGSFKLRLIPVWLVGLSQ